VSAPGAGGWNALEGPSGVNLRAPIARANPVAKLAVSLAVALALLPTVDLVTPSVALLLEVAALPWCGVGAWALWRRGWILVAAAVPTVLVAALFGLDSGSVLVQWGPISVTEGSLRDGVAVGLRIFAIGLPGVVLLATTDPTDLADALAQNLKLPHRFVLAALAAMRLFGVMAEEWRMLSLARRARGLGDDGPIGRVRTFCGQIFALLVLAVRRATVLAIVMEARGFGADLGPGRSRTWARVARFRWSDGAVLAGGVAIGVIATWVSVAVGAWNPILA
jgi:energy-coupling factor transport system permease protein